jgi:twitching motility protein PilU
VINKSDAFCVHINSNNFSKSILFSSVTLTEHISVDSLNHSRLGWECNFAISRSGLGRFRVSAFTQRDAAGMVLRRIESDIPDWESLHLPPTLKDVIMENRGLVLFVGATGTGKSTSLASLIKYRNRLHCLRVR